MQVAYMLRTDLGSDERWGFIQKTGDTLEGAGTFQGVSPKARMTLSESVWLVPGTIED